MNGFEKYHSVRSIPASVESGLREKPQFSIAIPTFRRPELLREAVASALAQSPEGTFEVIVSDNDPDGGSAVPDMLKTFHSPQLKYFRNERNIGMFGNWNRCIELAEGEYLTILNDDDLLLPGFLRLAEEQLPLSPSGVMFHHRMRYDCFPAEQRRKMERIHRFRRGIRNAAAKLSGKGARALSPRDFLFFMPVPGTLGIVWKTEFLKSGEGYDESLFPSADLFFACDYVRRHGMMKSNAAAAVYRLSVNESLNPESQRRMARLHYAFSKRMLAEEASVTPADRFFFDACWYAKLKKWGIEKEFYPDVSKFRELRYLLESRFYLNLLLFGFVL